MDLTAIRAKLEALNTVQQDRTDFSKIFWKPEMGKQVVRILPSVYDSTMPFTELKFHYGVGKNPMIALSNYGKQDPIEEFIKELKKTSDKENWSMAGKLTPKSRFFVPVIVRGQEDQGVRLWNFGITMYKSLLQLASDEEVGDYSDPINGTDLTVTQVAGTPYPETTIMPKRSNSSLSTDAEQVKLWLREQPNPREVFRPYEYEYMKKQLEMYLNPGMTEDETGTDTGTSVIPGTPKPSTPSTYKLEQVAAPVKSNVAEFDDLFSDNLPPVDDLPF